MLDSLRYDAMSRSPVNSTFATSPESLMTIRAYARSRWLRDQFERNLVEANGKAYFTYLCAGRWLSLNLEPTVVLFFCAALIESFFAEQSSTEEQRHSHF